MSKNQYIVTPRNESSVVVVGLDIKCTGTAVMVLTDGSEVAAYFPDVVSVVKQEIAQGAEPAVIAVEAAKYSLGCGSAFLSAPSPLVEAIESTARLVWEAPTSVDREILKSHLVSLIEEQLHQLVPAIPNESPSGVGRRL